MANKMSSETSNPPVHIPEQEKGGKTDTDFSITAETKEEAHRLFLESKARLLNINDWDKICGAFSADFSLMDSTGNQVSRNAEVGDHFKINIPGPGTKTGDGYDWVAIEAIEDDTNENADVESMLIRVRPAENPTNEKKDVAHFFTNDASSSFTLHRSGNTVTAGVHGRNEVPNTRAETLLDKARNAAVAVGAILGLSNPQWKSLSKGVLGK